MKSAHAVFILLAASVSFVCAGYASAQTYSCPTSEVITVGTIESGSYLDLCAIDGSYEVLREGLYNGKSELKATVNRGKNAVNFELKSGSEIVQPDDEDQPKKGKIGKSKAVCA